MPQVCSTGRVGTSEKEVTRQVLQGLGQVDGMSLYFIFIQVLPFFIHEAFTGYGGLMHTQVPLQDLNQPRLSENNHVNTQQVPMQDLQPSKILQKQYCHHTTSAPSRPEPLETSGNVDVTT